MLKSCIDLDDPFALSIEERIIRHAKRLCVLFAVAALSLSALDLMSENSVENAAQYVHDNPLHLADMPRLIRSSLDAMAWAAPEPYATVAISTGDIAISARAAAAKLDASPIDRLAAADHEDAVAFAMQAPPVLVRRTPPPAAAAQPIKLASLTPDDVMTSISAPSSIAPAPSSMAALPPSIVLPATISLLPPLPPPLSPAQRLHLQGKARTRAELCLAKAIYFEARSQPFRGEVAVAQVVINRVFSPFFPDDVCSVVYQNASHYLACQFTFACDGRSKAIRERGAWGRARRIARLTLDGKLYVRAVGTATHYHAIYVHPYWTRDMHRLVREGIHTFYRPIAWGSGADEPIWSRQALAYQTKK